MDDNNGLIIQVINNIDFPANSETSRYYNVNGTAVPRVTEILSTMIHSDSLMYWANSLGLKGMKYKETLNKAALVGTTSHAAIEKFLNTKKETKGDIPFLGFLAWYNTITNSGVPIEVIYVEHKLVSRWFGGTLDALLNIGGRVFLVDFKTSNHVTYKYFLQLAAYRFMLKHVEYIDIDGVLVLQLDKSTPGFSEYVLDFNIPEHLEFIKECEEAFLSLVYGYYNIRKVEKHYGEIFGDNR